MTPASNAAPRSEFWSLLVWSTVACQSQAGSLERPSAVDDTATTNGNTGMGGTRGDPGGGGDAGQSSAGAAGDTSSTGTSSTGSGGSTSSGGSLNSASGSADSTSTGATGTATATSGGAPDCTFHTEPELEATGGQGGAGFEDVHLSTSNFIGDYLVDAAGRSLYIFGADLPGDCNTPPVSNCSADCILAWPSFDAGARSLGLGLLDEAFGTFTRADGLEQTTYRGWPLYYFKDDLAAGDLLGHNRGRVWFAAEAELPNVMVMRASEANGGIRYLGTERGHTLYAHNGDVAGTPDSPPVSSCAETCLTDTSPFWVTALRPAAPINPSDLTVFVRADGAGLQLAYKGRPLYTSSLDTQSGQLNGVLTDSFSVVEL